MPIDLICLDADDTLWHNMRFFHATQDALVRMLEPFADAGIARSSLEACEIRNLGLFGYGAKAFTLSMIETALDLGGDDVPATVIRDILEAGKALHAHPVELFDGCCTCAGRRGSRVGVVEAIRRHTIGTNDRRFNENRCRRMKHQNDCNLLTIQ